MMYLFLKSFKSKMILANFLNSLKVPYLLSLGNFNT